MDELTLLIGKKLLKRNYIPKMDRGDLINEVYAKIFWRQRQMEIKKVHDYFITALMNSVKDYYKQNSRDRDIFVDFNAAKYIADQSEVIDPETVLYYKELFNKAHEIMKEIDNPNHEKVIEMYFFQGFDYDEIVKETGLSSINCRKIVSRFKKIIKEGLLDG